MARKTFTKRIETELSEEEIGERKNRLVQANKQLFAVQSEKSSAMQEFNADLKSVRQNMRDLVAAIETGKDSEDIEAYEQACKDRNVVLVLRASDDVLIEERPMTEDERQGDLFGAGGNGDGDGDQDDGAGDDQGDDDDEPDPEAVAAAAEKLKAGMSSSSKLTRVPPGKRSPRRPQTEAH